MSTFLFFNRKSRSTNTSSETVLNEKPLPTQGKKKRGRKPKDVSFISELTNICVDVNVFDEYVSLREKYKRLSHNRGLTNSEFVSLLLKNFNALDNE